MEELNYKRIKASGYKGYILEEAPEKILQFGEGNFLRAFVDYWFDVSNERVGWNGKAVLVQPIAQGLAGMVHIFNPQLILIGGGVSAQEKFLIEPVAAKVRRSIMPAFAEGLEIRAAQLHNDAGMVGAVYYFRQTMENT